MLNFRNGPIPNAHVSVTARLTHVQRRPGWRSSAAGTAEALGTAASVVQHLAQAPWLAKDVVWLVTDARCGLTPSMQVHSWDAGVCSRFTDSIKQCATMEAGRGPARFLQYFLLSPRAQVMCQQKHYQCHVQQCHSL